MYDFKNPNILMRFSFKESEQMMFVYSNLNGLEHLEQVLQDNQLFCNLLTPKEIFTKLSEQISYNFFGNNYNGIESCEWVGKNVTLMSNEEKDFFKAFDVWITQLEKLVGKANLFKVSIPEQKIDSYTQGDTTTDSQKNLNFINYLEAYRLNTYLNETLTGDKFSNKSTKI